MRRPRYDLLRPRILDWVRREPGEFTPNRLTWHLGCRRSVARGAIRDLLECGEVALDSTGRLIPETPSSQDPIAGPHVDRAET